MDDFARRSDLLIPEERGHGSGLHRTRSQGHTPAPNVTVYNTTHMDQDANPRVEQRGSPGAAARASPRGRMPGEWALEDEIEALRHELARERRSSASRPAHRDHSADYERWQLEATKARLKEAEDRLEQEQHDELIRRRLELKYMKERQERGDEDARVKADGKRLRDEWDLRQEREERRREQRMREQDEERRRIIAENTTKLEREDRERAEARQRAVDEFNRKKADQDRKAKEERDKAIADYERKKVEDAAKTKREREALVLQLKLEEDARKKKEKDEYEHFLRIQKQKEEDEKAKKKKHEAELEEQMRKRLAQFGFQENQIVAMIKPEKAKELHQGQTPLNPLPMTPYQHYQPTYPKIHRDHVAVDTLVYYDIPYEYDRVRRRSRFPASGLCRRHFPSCTPRRWAL